MVTLGTGVGGGVVLDGKMLTGYTGAASELGHMVIRAGGEECTCGRRGCFEAYASATALIRETKRAMAAHPESRMHAAAEENGAVDGRTAFIAAQRGDAAAQAVVDRYLDDLACGVANIVNIFFPEVIALSGGVANQGDALLVPLRERVRALSYGYAMPCVTRASSSARSATARASSARRCWRSRAEGKNEAMVRRAAAAAAALLAAPDDEIYPAALAAASP